MADTGIPPLYDVEQGLRELARQRLKQDTLTASQVCLADNLVAHLLRHFAPEEAETAGRALLIGAASCASLTEEAPEIPAPVVVNILAFAAARMITDGRAWLGAQDGGGGDG